MKKHFIGIDDNNTPHLESSSLLFRRTFYINKKNGKYILNIIGLGMGKYFLNGLSITKSILLQAPSDYEKTLWMDTFDVTKLIKEGKNVLAIELGNGFFNEGIETTWYLNNAYWKKPKCVNLELKNNNKIILYSDEQFKVKYSSFRTFNELRCGENVDFNHYEEFNNPSYDDSTWLPAKKVMNPPKGVIRPLCCEHMEEFNRYKPSKIRKFKDRILIDFGVNFSGYVEVTLKEKKNKEVTIKYAEDIDQNNNIDLHGLNCYHKNCDFQSEKIICDGNKITFKPTFTYFGFRYVEIKGISEINDFDIVGIFTHQALKVKKRNNIKDEKIKKLYDAVINSTLSNTYYMLTDCPTREKLGWLNDAQSSLEQLILNFNAKKLLKKWYQDILDSMDKKGNVPGIAPSHKWGYEYGPLCGAIIGTIPYYFAKYYHDDSLFIKGIKKIEKYLIFVKNHENMFILGDWTGSTNHPYTPKEFTIKTYEYILNYFLYYFFRKHGNKEMMKKYNIEMKLIKNELLEFYKNSEFKDVSQTMISVLIVLRISDKELNKTLIKCIETNNYQIEMGMFGNQFIYKALKLINRDDLIYKIAFNDGNKSFLRWLEKGHNTLFETFDDTWTLSMNHHMYSNVIMGLIK